MFIYNICKMECTEEDEDKFLQIMRLLQEKTDLENKLRVMENKVIDKDELLEYFTSKQVKEGNRARKVPSPKTKFYQEHRDDESILEQLKPFKEAYPNVKIPVALVRSLTDAKFKASLNK
jgi:hypothetical protein